MFTLFCCAIRLGLRLGSVLVRAGGRGLFTQLRLQVGTKHDRSLFYSIVFFFFLRRCSFKHAALWQSSSMLSWKGGALCARFLNDKSHQMQGRRLNCRPCLSSIGSIKECLLQSALSLLWVLHCSSGSSSEASLVLLWSLLLDVLSSSLLLCPFAGQPGRISDELVPFPEGPDDGCV